MKKAKKYPCNPCHPWLIPNFIAAKGTLGCRISDMPADESREPTETLAVDLPEFLEAAAQQTWPLKQPGGLTGPQSYRLAFGHRPIQLGNLEFRILLFLASRPYHAFTHRAIAAAVSTDLDTLAESDVDQVIASLRDQLGVLHDYVQTVPHIGYRFKA